MCFISDGWDGRLSNKHLTEYSNMLSHITPIKDLTLRNQLVYTVLVLLFLQTLQHKRSS